MPAVKNVDGISFTVISLALDGQPIESDEHGCLGQLGAGGRITLIVNGAAKAPVIGLNVEKRGDGALAVCEKRDLSLNGGSFHYERDVTIHQGIGGRSPYVKPGQNSLTLCEYDETGGGMRLHEVSVVVQRGEFFLAYQAGRHQAHWKEGPCFPSLRRWVFPKGLLMQILGKCSAESLPPLESWKDRTLPETKGLRSKHAKVVYWSDARGLGAVVTPDADGLVRLHRSHLKSAQGRLTSPQSGDCVRFTRLGRMPNDGSVNVIEFQLIDACAGL